MFSNKCGDPGLWNGLRWRFVGISVLILGSALKVCICCKCGRTVFLLALGGHEVSMKLPIENLHTWKPFFLIWHTWNYGSIFQGMLFRRGFTLGPCGLCLCIFLGPTMRMAALSGISLISSLSFLSWLVALDQCMTSWTNGRYPLVRLKEDLSS